MSVAKPLASSACTEPALQSLLLSRGTRFSHGFFGRQASASPPIPSNSLGDNLDACCKLGLLASKLDSRFSHFMCVRQFHSNRVISLTDTTSLFSSHARAPQGDGIITNLAGVLLGVYTADCAPILFADSKTGTCGVAHAGWRGALSGIIESLVAGMVVLGSRVEDIDVAIGPTISVSSYPVSDDFLTAILEREINLTKDNGVFFRRISENRSSENRGSEGCSSQTWHFDLGEYTCARLRGCGISDDRINFLRLDTFSDARYFSHRRSLRMGDGEGRNFSCIGLL